MKSNNEGTSSMLDGLRDVLPTEVLKMLNELLEQLQRTGHTNKGSNVINIYALGSQHVDTQVIASPCPETLPSPKTHPAPPCLGREKGAESSATALYPAPKRGVELLPEVLRTEKAMAMWRKVQAVGYVDEDYQPTISRTRAALLADAMAERLGVKEKWKVFETLWNRKYMRSDYNLALTQQQSLDFQDELKSVLI